MKKTLSLALALVLIVSAFAVFSVFTSAEGTPALVVSDAAGTPGETVQVTVSIENNPGIWGADIVIVPDEGLTLTAVDYNADFPFTWTKGAELTTLKLSGEMDGFDDTDYNGVIATLTFEVAADAEGTLKVAPTYNTGDICNAAEQDVELATVAGKVTVSGGTEPPVYNDVVEAFADGMENWSGSPNKTDEYPKVTQILICPDPWDGAYYVPGLTLTINMKASDGSTDDTFTTNVVTVYNAGDWGILRVEPCLMETPWIPVKDMVYELTLTYTTPDGRTVTVKSEDPFVLKEDPVVPSSGPVEPPVEEDGWKWVIDGSTLYITGKGEMEDFRGNEDGRPWLDKADKITKVVVCDGITNVGSSAFTGFENLKEVVVGRDVTKIGMDAFSYCHNLTTITFNGTITEVGQGTVYDCPALANVTVTGQTKDEFREVATVKPYNDAYFNAANFKTQETGNAVTYEGGKTPTPGAGEATAAIVVLSLLALVGTAVVVSKKVFVK